ncbi:MAG TPA: hypothetical protein DCQ14_05830 [Firmicutes bacterium]|nr:hypothetical protein [Bacillota bacterium]
MRIFNKNIFIVSRNYSQGDRDEYDRKKDYSIYGKKITSPKNNLLTVPDCKGETSVIMKRIKSSLLLRLSSPLPIILT